MTQDRPPRRPNRTGSNSSSDRDPDRDGNSDDRGHSDSKTDRRRPLDFASFGRIGQDARGGKYDSDDDDREPGIHPRVLGRRMANTLWNRMVPSMMRSASFWITAGLIVGIYLVAFLFVKDMVILPARVAPDSAPPLSFVRQVLSGFAGDYEEKVLETKPDGSIVVEQRYTVPTKFVDPAPTKSDTDKEKVAERDKADKKAKQEVPALLKAPEPASPAQTQPQIQTPESGSPAASAPQLEPAPPLAPATSAP